MREDTGRALPELMRFADGRRVETPEDWAERRKEILALFETSMYGRMPDPSREKVTYEIVPGEAERTYDMKISVSRKGRMASFTVRATLPETPADGRPCYIEYCPFSWFGKPLNSPNMKIAAGRGYAAIQYDPTAVASDNDLHEGAYFELYPYGEDKDRQDGVLLAWAWGASRILDALEAGAGKQLGIDPGMCMVAGVSRYGKSAAVAGAYDERFRVTIPSCSGAGGIAVYRTDNHGKTYDLSALGGPESWTNESINEPFENLTGGEGYWFCENFRRTKRAEDLPADQHMLCALAAGKDRHLIVITGITSEGWNNTEGQCLAYVASQPVWDLLGAGDQNNMIIHLDGHAILPSDMELILNYCDAHLPGKKADGAAGRPAGMKGQLFLKYNRGRLDPVFDQYEAEIQSVLAHGDTGEPGLRRKTVRVAAAVIFHDGKMYATQRGYGPWRDYWEFPGGKIEPGETPEAALVREIREELDVTVTVLGHLCDVEYDYPEFHLSMRCFRCRIDKGEPKLLEHEAARWLAKEEIYGVGWLPADREILPDIEKSWPV